LGCWSDIGIGHADLAWICERKESGPSDDYFGGTSFFLSLFPNDLILVQLYTKSYELFKKYSPVNTQNQSQGRLTLRIAYRIAQTYYEAKKFDMAVRCIPIVLPVKWESDLTTHYAGFLSASPRHIAVRNGLTYCSHYLQRGIPVLSSSGTWSLASSCSLRCSAIVRVFRFLIFFANFFFISGPPSDGQDVENWAEKLLAVLKVDALRHQLFCSP